MKKDYDITKAKLIIWDLDDTLWQGILSEPESLKVNDVSDNKTPKSGCRVNFNLQNLKFIQELTTKGIMNSICSKNNFENVKEEFINGGFQNFWEFFVFPSIDWTPKGIRVKNIIRNMNLREENVIFIDDNISNINEVKFYCPQIMTALPEQIKKMSEELYLVNDYDFEHTRLKQYKLLEQKAEARENSSNEDFLRSSGIKISIKKDCLENIERIKKLISRTNQLNFTKFRDENIENTIKNTESAYIIAEDKFGNYGICGFYSLDKKENKLVHFLFSCRIMNMGIEQFVYSYLNKPELEIRGEVASDINIPADWITLVDNLEVRQVLPKPENNINILFKGPCDLYSALSYIDAECNIDTEFPYWNKQLVYILAHTHTAFIEQTHKLPHQKILELTQRFPFPNPDEFKTSFFDKKYNLIFLSLLTVTHSGLYINNNDGCYAFFGYADCDITDKDNWEKILAPLPENARAQNLIMLEDFRKNYTFAGNPPVETVIKNLEYIKENINGELVLILGSEIPTDKVLAGYENMASRHQILNNAVRDVMQGKAKFIELSDFIKSDDDYTTCINHFSRRVYAKLAEKIVETANEILGKEYLSLKKHNLSEIAI